MFSFSLKTFFSFSFKPFPSANARKYASEALGLINCESSDVRGGPTYRNGLNVVTKGVKMVLQTKLCVTRLLSKFQRSRKPGEESRFNPNGLMTGNIL